MIRLLTFLSIITLLSNYVFGGEDKFSTYLQIRFSGKLPALNMYSKQNIAYMDIRKHTALQNYTEMTVCMRANYRSFFPSAYNHLFTFDHQDEKLQNFWWSFCLFEPFHSMRDLDKQVQYENSKDRH